MQNIRRFFLTTIIFLFIGGDFHAYQDPEPAPKTLTMVVLRGRLMQTRTRMTPNITVLQNCKYVQVNFIRTVGVVDVAVQTSDSILYQNRVNATGGSNISVETGSWKPGKYIVSVCNMEKLCAHGEFVIEAANPPSKN